MVQRTLIFTVAPRPTVDNQLVRVPASGEQTIPNLGYTGIEILINLTTADKEAVGKTLALNIYRSPGDTFVAGFNWTSYGGPLTIRDLDGTIRLDPDPALRIATSNIAGQSIHLTYMANGISTAGVTVNGLK